MNTQKYFGFVITFYGQLYFQMYCNHISFISNSYFVLKTLTS